MRKSILAILSMVCTFYSYSTSVYSSIELKAKQVSIVIPGTNERINLVDYVKLKASQLKKLTGKKLTLKERIVFKINQKQLKKTIRKDGSIDMDAYKKAAEEPFKWHWGGFFLGMLFPIGFIITLCIKDEKRKNRIRSSLFGIATVLLISLLIGILIAPIGI